MKVDATNTIHQRVSIKIQNRRRGAIRAATIPEPMTGWTTLKDDEVLNQFNDSETDAYNTAKGDAKGGSLADIIGKVMDQVRQAYADAARIVDPLPQTIPDGEKNRAIATSCAGNFSWPCPPAKACRRKNAKKRTTMRKPIF